MISSKKTLEDKHINWIDYLKGIGITLVVIGHITGIEEVLKAYIYTFHMPLFFFISGFLFKCNRSIARTALRLLLPLLTYMLLIVVPFEMNQLILEKTTITKIVWRFINVYTSSEATAFWFPYSLFIGLTMYGFFINKTKGNYSFYLCCIFLIIAYLLDSIGLEQKYYPFAINRIFFIIPLIHLGYQYKKNESFFKNKFVLFFIIFFTILNIIISDYNIIDIKNGHFGLVLWSFIGAGATVLFLATVLKNTEKYFRLTLLSYIGEASLTIMYLHIIINKLIIDIIGYHSFNFIIVITVCCILHFIFKGFRITRLLFLGIK